MPGRREARARTFTVRLLRDRENQPSIEKQGNKPLEGKPRSSETNNKDRIDLPAVLIGKLFPRGTRELKSKLQNIYTQLSSLYVTSMYQRVRIRAHDACTDESLGRHRPMTVVLSEEGNKVEGTFFLHLNGFVFFFLQARAHAFDMWTSSVNQKA